MTADRGTAVLLALDGIDPRLGPDERSDAAASALDLDPFTAALTWSSLLFAIVHDVHARHGTERSGDLMHSLTSLAMNVHQVMGPLDPR